MLENRIDRTKLMLSLKLILEKSKDIFSEPSTVQVLTQEQLDMCVLNFLVSCSNSADDIMDE